MRDFGLPIFAAILWIVLAVTDEPPYGYRSDGTPKGVGYLGLIETPSGVMSEKSISIEVDGVDYLIPLIVPTLTQAELDVLKTYTGSVRDLPRSIIDRAVAHAMMRQEKGLNLFAD